MQYSVYTHIHAHTLDLPLLDYFSHSGPYPTRRGCSVSLGVQVPGTCTCPHPARWLARSARTSRDTKMLCSRAGPMQPLHGGILCQHGDEISMRGGNGAEPRAAGRDTPSLCTHSLPKVGRGRWGSSQPCFLSHSLQSSEMSPGAWSPLQTAARPALV